MWMILSRKSKTTKEELLESLAKEDTQILALAYAHAQYLKMYGVDIERALYTATENAEVMTRAYQRGYYDAMKQEPCEDAISRQAVNILVDELARAISDERCCISRGRSTATIMQDILDLPPVKPQERTGKL